VTAKASACGTWNLEPGTRAPSCPSCRSCYPVLRGAGTWNLEPGRTRTHPPPRAEESWRFTPARSCLGDHRTPEAQRDDDHAAATVRWKEDLVPPMSFTLPAPGPGRARRKAPPPRGPPNPRRPSTGQIRPDPVRPRRRSTPYRPDPATSAQSAIAPPARSGQAEAVQYPLPATSGRIRSGRGGPVPLTDHLAEAHWPEACGRKAGRRAALRLPHSWIAPGLAACLYQPRRAW